MSVDISKLNDALLIICGVVLFLLTLLLFFVILLRKRHNYFLKERELMESRFAQELLQSQLEIQEQSFAQISAEIHDNIGQLLSLVRLNLNTKGFPQSEEKLQFTDEVLGRAIADLRSLSHNLNASHILAAGFPSAVRFLLKSLEQTSLFQTTFTCEDDLTDLSDEQTLILFRIVQEAINNIVKHAGADTITCCITKEESGRRLITISDNGKGMPLNLTSSGIGLQNMHHRAALIGARLQFEKAAGGGTIVTLFI